MKKIKLEQMDIEECIAVARERKIVEADEFRKNVAQIIENAIDHEVKKLRDSGLFSPAQLKEATWEAEYNFGAPIETDEGLCSRIIIGWRVWVVAKLVEVSPEKVREMIEGDDLSAYENTFGNRIVLAEDIISFKEDRLHYE